MSRYYSATITSPYGWEEFRFQDGTPYWRHADTKERTMLNPRHGFLPPGWIEVHLDNWILLELRFSGITTMTRDPRELYRSRDLVGLRLAWRRLRDGGQVDLLQVIANTINDELPLLNSRLDNRNSIAVICGRYDTSLARDVEAIETWLAMASEALRNRKLELTRISGSENQGARVNELLADIEKLEPMLGEVGRTVRDSSGPPSSYKTLLEKLGQWNSKLKRHLR